MTAETLALDDVTVRIDGRTVLADLSWSVEPGQRWVVLGPNGSGKTTLLRVASLYLHPTGGSVRVLGQTVGRLDVRAMRPRIGLTSAALANQIRPEVSARDAVMTARFGALEAWWHTYGDADRARAQDLLDRVGLADKAEHYSRDLTQVEMRKLELARALAADPKLLIADESMAGLSQAEVADIVALLIDLNKRGITIILIEHIMRAVMSFSQRLVVLVSGKKIADGDPDVVIRNPEVERAYLGV